MSVYMYIRLDDRKFFKDNFKWKSAEAISDNLVAN